MTGGWQLLKRSPERGMYGSAENGFPGIKGFSIAMTAATISKHKKQFKQQKALYCSSGDPVFSRAKAKAIILMAFYFFAPLTPYNEKTGHIPPRFASK